MLSDIDRSYYRRRASQERARAMRSEDLRVRAAHRQLAAAYEAYAEGAPLRTSDMPIIGAGARG